MVVAKYLISAEPPCTPQNPRHRPGFLLRKSETNAELGQKRSSLPENRLPVFPQQQTSRVRAATSEKCQTTEVTPSSQMPSCH